MATTRTHDPSEYMRGIQQILISDKKRIGFLFGAGSSLAKKNENSLTVPAIGKMTSDIVELIGNDSAIFKTAFDEIKVELGEKNFNIETVLSNLEQKATFIGGGKLNGLEKTDFENLIIEIKKNVRKMVSVHKSSDTQIASNSIVADLVHTDFANWIGQAERKYPIEIFTTNYDFLFELGLECKEVPYYDGFCGSLRPFFNPQSVEDLAFLAKQTKLWKIHGSLGWHFDKDSGKILRVNPDDDDILIYPSTLKYKDSKKQPYESLLDRMSNFLKQDDSILFTCGYSWGDEHINSRIVSALKTHTTSHVIGLIFDKPDSLTSESNLVKLGLDNTKISLYGSRSAVIGCCYGAWLLKTKPQASDNVGQFFNADPEEADEWVGTGEFLLADFNRLVMFLNAMINDNEIRRLGVNVKK
jgi:hypothetical protein